ncbi:hypothetical protein DFP72DRAFT_1085900 [Ephemerocybe angulata]|uniref:Secreted protein n=1 Tax=Ephemerocybe angulata TaxID=980116 RepID=A0A8H6LU40_9AGAR|nr:hypothetical protein DFP72DRAFT_1085900 [Tulosesus angulatus]
MPRRLAASILRMLVSFHVHGAARGTKFCCNFAIDNSPPTSPIAALQTYPSSCTTSLAGRISVVIRHYPDQYTPSIPRLASSTPSEHPSDARVLLGFGMILIMRGFPSVRRTLGNWMETRAGLGNGFPGENARVLPSCSADSIVSLLCHLRPLRAQTPSSTYRCHTPLLAHPARRNHFYCYIAILATRDAIPPSRPIWTFKIISLFVRQQPAEPDNDLDLSFAAACDTPSAGRHEPMLTYEPQEHADLGGS